MGLDVPKVAAPRHDFADSAALAGALAEAVASNLRDGLAARGSASLAVSGGRTPEQFFAALSRQPLDWYKVTITLVDERWVAPDHPRSNEALLRRCLLQGPAADAQLVSLVTKDASPEEGRTEIAGRVAALPQPLDAVVLGMGSDGHTASFFPGGDRLAEVLDPTCAAQVLPMRASGAGEPRMTLTLPLIAAARTVYLHIEGAEKSEVLARALQDGPAEELPVRAVLQGCARPLQIYWCP